jgi:hypothetical protein
VQVLQTVVAHPGWGMGVEPRLKENQMNSWHSYPSVYALGHSAITELLFDSILVEEKIDGSQFSWGRFNGELKARSKGKEIVLDNPEKMFQKAIDSIKNLDLHDGWTYRAEYLSKPKHNVLLYGRIPKGNLILFDVNVGNEEYLSYSNKKSEADRLGLEIVPLIYEGVISAPDTMKSFLERESILGGTTIEGVVIKNYARFGRDKKVLMGKYVSEGFKEVHQKEWKIQNPTQSDVIQQLVAMHRTTERWNKGVMHLAESGNLQNAPQDIGNLMKEVKADILKECEEEIKNVLFKNAIDKILRGCIVGLPEWYKEKLLNNQFEENKTKEEV